MEARVTGSRMLLLRVTAVACVLAPLMMLAGLYSPIRVAAGLVLFGLAPGAALLPLLAPRRPSVELALAVATSLAVSALIAQAMLSLGAWSPTAGTWVLALVCLASIATQLTVGRSGRAS